MIKILVIDDDKLIRWSLTQIFSQEGYTVKAVATAKEALKQISNISYHLIITDLEISEERGIGILKKIKEFQPTAKNIILSAFARNQVESMLGDLTVSSVIEKPFQSEQIKSIARDALAIKNFKKGENKRT